LCQLHSLLIERFNAIEAAAPGVGPATPHYNDYESLKDDAINNQLRTHYRIVSATPQQRAAIWAWQAQVQMRLRTVQLNGRTTKVLLDAPMTNTFLAGLQNGQIVFEAHPAGRTRR
jgi:hypothetical protein